MKTAILNWADRHPGTAIIAALTPYVLIDIHWEPDGELLFIATIAAVIIHQWKREGML